MNTSPMLLDLLVGESQQAIALDAEHRRLISEAHLDSHPATLRQTVGRALISLGERIGGVHHDAFASIAVDGTLTRHPASGAAQRAA